MDYEDASAADPITTMRDHSNINKSSAQNNLHQYLNEPEISKS